MPIYQDATGGAPIDTVLDLSSSVNTTLPQWGITVPCVLNNPGLIVSLPTIGTGDIGKSITIFNAGTNSFAIGLPGGSILFPGGVTIDPGKVLEVRALTTTTAVVSGTNSSSAAAGGAIIGDCKSGFQIVDHAGWIALNGRLKSTLTATQQAAASSLGIGANLPNADGRTFVQGTVGAQIGSNLILQGNLPNYNLAITSDSAGTPAGTIGAVSAGTPAGTLNSVSAGTPAGSINSVSAGTPAGSINTVGDHTHGYNIPYASNGRFDGSQNGGSAFGTNQAYTSGAGGSHSHNFTGTALAAHTHNFTGTALAAHTHTFIGTALGGHAHTFTGAALGSHSHTVPLGGSSNPYTPAAIGVNHFIFLGA
jgi:hypothetical protein